jgi:methyl-accepting chemotaxis protein
MDGVTQQNAALVEESAAATRAMHEQAQALAGLVEVFRVQAKSQPAPAPKPALPPARRAAPARAAKPPARPARTAAARKAPATVEADWEEF